MPGHPAAFRPAAAGVALKSLFRFEGRGCWSSMDMDGGCTEGRKDGRKEGGLSHPRPTRRGVFVVIYCCCPGLRLLLLLHFPAAPVLCDFFWGHALLFWSLPLPHPVAQAQDTSTSLPWIKLHFKSLILIWRGWQMDCQFPDKGLSNWISHPDITPGVVFFPGAHGVYIHVYGVSPLRRTTGIQQDEQDSGKRRKEAISGRCLCGRLFNLWLDCRAVDV